MRTICVTNCRATTENSCSRIVWYFASIVCHQLWLYHTARTQYRKFETNIPRKRIAHGLNPNFHSHVSVSDLYIPKIGLPILLQENIWTDSGNI
jgi:hypothetical protein